MDDELGKLNGSDLIVFNENNQLVRIYRTNISPSVWVAEDIEFPYHVRKISRNARNGVTAVLLTNGDFWLMYNNVCEPGDPFSINYLRLMDDHLYGPEDSFFLKLSLGFSIVDFVFHQRRRIFYILDSSGNLHHDRHRLDDPKIIMTSVRSIVTKKGRSL